MSGHQSFLVLVQYSVSHDDDRAVIIKGTLTIFYIQCNEFTLVPVPIGRFWSI